MWHRYGYKDAPENNLAVSAPAARTMRHCFSAPVTVGRYPRHTRGTAHDNQISHKSARNAGEMSLRRRMLLPGVALEQALHDHEGSYPRNGGKSLRDHGKAMKNAASPPVPGGNRHIQDTETSRLADRGPSGY